MSLICEGVFDQYPRLRKLPPEYFREHFWLSPQPIEEPDNPRHLGQAVGPGGPVAASRHPHAPGK